jgi:hypothetical protein
MYVPFSACISEVPTGRISVKFYAGEFSENMSKEPNFVKIGQKYRELCMKAYVTFMVAGDNKSQ